LKLIATPLTVNPSSPSSIQQTTSTTFTLIDCDPVPGNIQPIDVVKQAIVRNALAIILYSTVSNYCTLQTGTGVPDSYVIYSTTSTADYQKLTRGTSNFSPTGSSNQWSIGKKSTLDNSSSTMSSNGQNNPNYSPGGPSPSTAVAMIILYSITGVITALFLVIIVTGAVRAHRHPERYGPRNVLGRPRQSRARGLARAMLETLPIVKFGEKEEDAKTGDVELAEPTTAHARNVEESATGVETVETATGSHEDAGTHKAEKSDSTEIEAAGAVAARTSPEPAVSVDDDNLGCSICTEDFEKGQDVRVLPCKHQFHPACIDPWLLNVSGTCPLWYVCPTAFRYH
jgi:RING-like zinc finger